MKKQFLATLVLVVSVFATAHAGSTSNSADKSTSKKINLTETGFTKLVVSGNVDVVLFQDDTNSSVRTFGNEADIASTSITQSNGVLTISNRKENGQKVLVYVPVSRLSVIEARGNSKVSSASLLNSQQITLVVKGDCKLNIQNAGAIDVVQEGDVEVTVERRELVKNHS
jgi:Putative auto-transporter adhesin, head GIN domain